jgi:hypothetical protein
VNADRKTDRRTDRHITLLYDKIAKNFSLVLFFLCFKLNTLVKYFNSICKTSNLYSKGGVPYPGRDHDISYKIFRVMAPTLESVSFYDSFVNTSQIRVRGVF